MRSKEEHHKQSSHVDSRVATGCVVGEELLRSMERATCALLNEVDGTTHGNDPCQKALEDWNLADRHWDNPRGTDSSYFIRNASSSVREKVIT